MKVDFAHPLQVAKDAVVVEADAIKNKDVVYQQLNRRLSRMGRSTSDLSKYVHEYSTKAAESMFVAAINQQRVRQPRISSNLGAQFVPAVCETSVFVDAITPSSSCVAHLPPYAGT